LEEYYQEYLKAKGNTDEQQKIANQFIWEVETPPQKVLNCQLARHHVGEELVVYPVMQKVLTDGNDLVSKDRNAHHDVAELLYRLQEKSTSDPDFPKTFDEVMGVLRPHLRDEEETDIPELEAKLSREESARLAKQFTKTKKLAPTRSHPYATSFEPPFETALALITAPIDKVSCR
jgi:hypothetical protein